MSQPSSPSRQQELENQQRSLLVNSNSNRPSLNEQRQQQQQPAGVYNPNAAGEQVLNYNMPMNNAMAQAQEAMRMARTRYKAMETTKKKPDNVLPADEEVAFVIHSFYPEILEEILNYWQQLQSLRGVFFIKIIYRNYS